LAHSNHPQSPSVVRAACLSPFGAALRLNRCGFFLAPLAVTHAPQLLPVPLPHSPRLHVRSVHLGGPRCSLRRNVYGQRPAPCGTAQGLASGRNFYMGPVVPGASGMLQPFCTTVHTATEPRARLAGPHLLEYVFGPPFFYSDLRKTPARPCLLGRLQSGSRSWVPLVRSNAT